MYGDVGGFVVADFADQDDIGVMSEYGAQGAGEAKPDFGVHLYLRAAAKLILHRVFDGDYFTFRICVAHISQGGVQRGGFTAAGRAGDQDDAMRYGDKAGEQLELVFAQAQVAHLDEDGAAGKDAQADGLAKTGWYDGYAQVGGLAGAHQAYAPVMRQAFFSDIEPGHDFKPGDYGLVQLQHARRGRYLAQHSVYAVAQFNQLAERLYVYVGGLLTYGIGYDLVDQLYDGSVAAVVLVQVFHLAVVKGALDLFKLGGFAVLAYLDDFFGSQAIQAFEVEIDLGGGGDDRVEAQAEQQTQVFAVADGWRIGKGGFQGAAFQLHGHELIAQGHPGGDFLRRLL